MLIYAMSVPSYYDQGIYKIGEAINDTQLKKRKKTFQTSHIEAVEIYGLWEIGELASKADNRLHTIFDDFRTGCGGTEFFKGVSLDLLHEKIVYVFGYEVVRLL